MELLALCIIQAIPKGMEQIHRGLAQTDEPDQGERETEPGDNQQLKANQQLLAIAGAPLALYRSPLPNRKGWESCVRMLVLDGSQTREPHVRLAKVDTTPLLSQPAKIP